MKNLEQALCLRLQQLHTLASGSIGDLLQLELVSCNPDMAEYIMRCKTYDWMRNIAGTLHGGMCATLVDQAMGCVAYCAKPGDGTAPTVQMNVTYHRPLQPGQDVLIKVRVISAGKTLMHLSADAYLEEQPDKVCLSSTAVYCYKPLQK